MLQLIANTLTNKELASIFGIGESTMARYRKKECLGHTAYLYPIYLNAIRGENLKITKHNALDFVAQAVRCPDIKDMYVSASQNFGWSGEPTVAMQAFYEHLKSKIFDYSHHLSNKSKRFVYTLAMTKLLYLMPFLHSHNEYIDGTLVRVLAKDTANGNVQAVLRTSLEKGYFSKAFLTPLLKKAGWEHADNYELYSRQTLEFMYPHMQKFAPSIFYNDAQLMFCAVDPILSRYFIAFSEYISTYLGPWSGNHAEHEAYAKEHTHLVNLVLKEMETL